MEFVETQIQSLLSELAVEIVSKHVEALLAAHMNPLSSQHSTNNQGPFTRLLHINAALLTTVQTLKGQNHTLNKEVTELKDDKANLSATVETLLSALTESQSQISCLQLALPEKDRQIETILHQKAELQFTVTGLKQQLAGFTDTKTMAECLAVQNQILLLQLEKMNHIAEEKQNQIGEITMTLTEMQNYVSNYQEALTGKLSQLTQQLQSVHFSDYKQIIDRQLSLVKELTETVKAASRRQSQVQLDKSPQILLQACDQTLLSDKGYSLHGVEQALTVTKQKVRRVVLNIRQQSRIFDNSLTDLSESLNRQNRLYVAQQDEIVSLRESNNSLISICRQIETDKKSVCSKVYHILESPCYQSKVDLINAVKSIQELSGENEGRLGKRRQWKDREVQTSNSIVVSFACQTGQLFGGIRTKLSNSKHNVSDSDTLSNQDVQYGESRKHLKESQLPSKIVQLNDILNYMLSYLKGYSSDGIKIGSYLEAESSKRGSHYSLRITHPSNIEAKMALASRVANTAQNQPCCTSLLHDFHEVADFYINRAQYATVPLKTRSHSNNSPLQQTLVKQKCLR